MLSAYESYWQHVREKSTIPIAFPINVEGNTGLGGGGVPFMQNDDARHHAYSDKCRDRAILAVLAINYGRQQLHAATGLLRISVNDPSSLD